MAVTANNVAVEEVEAMTTDLEGRLTEKDIVAWKEAVASYVRSYIFPGNNGPRMRIFVGGV